MDVQDSLVNEGLALWREMARCMMTSKFQHPHSHDFPPTQEGQRPEDCSAGVAGEASSGLVVFKQEMVPEAQIKLVVHLAAHGPQTMSEVADGLEVTTPAITGLVDKLEKRGMVERVRDQQDRRVVRVRLAPHAQQMAEAHITERRRQMRTVLETLTPEEQRTFIKTLRLMVQTMYPKQELVIVRE